MVYFNFAEFTGSKVFFIEAKFAGGEISFGYANYTGGEVSFDAMEYIPGCSVTWGPFESPAAWTGLQEGKRRQNEPSP
jgi:hypothetical protein